MQSKHASQVLAHNQQVRVRNAHGGKNSQRGKGGELRIGGNQTSRSNLNQ